MTDWPPTSSSTDTTTVELPLTNFHFHPSTPQPLNVAQEIPIPRKFRMDAITVLCTWPQCNKPLEEMATAIREMPNIEWYIVSAETHQTGEPHRHALIHFNRRKHWTNFKPFDDIGGKHGDYKPGKGLPTMIQYVCKEGQFVAHGIDVQKFLTAAKRHKSTTSTVVAEAILEGKSFQTILDHNPGFVLLHKKQILDFYDMKKEIDMKKALIPWTPIQMKNSQTAEERIIAGWLNKNVPLTPNRPLGETQLYIWGNTNLGKSHLAMQLSKYLLSYPCTNMEKFFDSLSEKHTLIIFDEFHGQHTITFMNQILDGQHMQIPQKGTMYFKTNNPMVIILSNFPPERCYPNIAEKYPEMFAAFTRRLTIVNINSRMNFF